MTTSRSKRKPEESQVETSKPTEGQDQTAQSLPEIPDDVPMPTIENAEQFLFRPGRDTGILDVFELCFAYLLFLTSSPVTVEKGALRSMPLSAQRYNELSDSAQRWMHKIPARGE